LPSSEGRFPKISECSTSGSSTSFEPASTTILPDFLLRSSSSECDLGLFSPRLPGVRPLTGAFDPFELLVTIAGGAYIDDKLFVLEKDLDLDKVDRSGKGKGAPFLTFAGKDNGNLRSGSPGRTFISESGDGRGFRRVTRSLRDDDSG
jgi:hypothetical protein